MRGGQLSWSNPVAEYITDSWWRESLLWFGWSDTKIAQWDSSKKDLEKPQDIEQEKARKEDKKKQDIWMWLLTEYGTWSLNAINYKRLWLSDNGEFTYTVLEYCAHSEDLCQDAYEKNIANEIVTLMRSDAAFIRKPFIWDLEWPDALVWLGESCIDESNMNAYHSYIYKNWVPDDTQKLEKIGEELAIDWFADCIAWWSAEVFITQQMKLGNSLFGVTKIPSYVLIDNTNKNRALIPGLYSLKEMGEVMTKEFDFTGME